MNCKRCTNDNLILSRQEQYEDRLIRENVKIDEEKGKVVASYPIIGDISALRDNKWQSIKLSESLERRLKKEGTMEA